MVLLVFPNAKQVSLPLYLVVPVFQENENAGIQDMLPETCLAKHFNSFVHIENEHFFQWGLLHAIPDSQGNNCHIWLQIGGRGRESHLQIPDPKISWKINMDVKLTLPI